MNRFPLKVDGSEYRLCRLHTFLFLMCVAFFSVGCFRVVFEGGSLFGVLVAWLGIMLYLKILEDDLRGDRKYWR